MRDHRDRERKKESSMERDCKEGKAGERGFESKTGGKREKSKTIEQEKEPSNSFQSIR